MDYPSATSIMHNALQAEINRLLEQCTEEQQDRFRKICPNHAVLHRDATDQNLRIAYDLIVRTLKKNAEEVTS